MKPLELHPLALIFPEMRADKYAKLKASIKKLGLIDPVTLFEGKVLDGRHRNRACSELGIAVRTEEFEGDDPLEFILAKNDVRRHLDESQRALVAARLATMKQGERTDLQPNRKTDKVSRSTAAAMLNVDEDTVSQARKVLETGEPSLVAAVERGEIAVNAARAVAALPAKDQERIVLMKDEGERKVAIRAAKDRASEERERKRDAKREGGPDLKLKGESATTPGVYSVEEWSKLSAPQRARIIESGFEAKSKMNPQTSTAIEWAQWSMNTVTGCEHDCPYCYARDIAERIYPEKFKPTFRPSHLAAPSCDTIPAEAKKDPSFRNVFANSMSDLFGQWVPEEWIEATIEMARRNSKWNFLTLTKFPQRAAKFKFPENWWMGTTVDAQARVDNAEAAFAKIECGTKWLSVEPLLQPLTFKRLDLFQWIVIGGASGSRKTPAWEPPIDWLASLHMAARAAGLRIYYKTNCGLSDAVRVREFPWAEPTPVKLPREFNYLKGMK